MRGGGRKDTILRVGGNFQNALYIIQSQLPASRFALRHGRSHFSRMVSIAKTFVRLEELPPTNHIVLDDLHGIMGCFPRLDSLAISISSCHFETESSSPPGSFITLDRLKRLTLCNIAYKHKPDFDVLMTAPNLSYLFQPTFRGLFSHLWKRLQQSHLPAGA